MPVRITKRAKANAGLTVQDAVEPAAAVAAVKKFKVGDIVASPFASNCGMS